MAWTRHHERKPKLLRLFSDQETLSFRNRKMFTSMWKCDRSLTMQIVKHGHFFSTFRLIDRWRWRKMESKRGIGKCQRNPNQRRARTLWMICCARSMPNRSIRLVRQTWTPRCTGRWAGAAAVSGVWGTWGSRCSIRTTIRARWEVASPSPTTRPV